MVRLVWKIASISFLLLSTSCVNEKQEGSTRIQLSGSALHKVAALANFPSDQKLCFGVNILNPIKLVNSANQTCAPKLGFYAGFVDKNQNINLSVPQGKAQKIQVFAYVFDLNENGPCPAFDKNVNLSKVYLAGEVVSLDLVEPEVQVSVPVSFPGLGQDLQSQLSSQGTCADLPNTEPPCDNNLEGQDLTLANGDILSGSYCNIGTLTIPGGTTVTLESLSAVSIEADSIDIQGTIDGNGKGYDTGAGPGAGTLLGEGGSHAGPGGGGVPAGTFVSYPDNPSEFGSGGFGDPSAFGGGFISLKATNTLNVDGSINVNGLAPTCSAGGGGGAGGSILLSANTLSGSGTLYANGGAGCSGGGGGSGGRVSLTYETNSSSIYISTGQNYFSGATPADYGAAGTIFYNDLATQQKVVEHKGSNSTETSGVLAFSTPIDTVKLSSQAYLNLSNVSVSNFNLSVDGGVLKITGSSNISGTLTCNQGTLSLTGTTDVETLIANGGTVEVSGSGLSFGTVNVGSGGTISHPQNYTSHDHDLRISADNINIAAGGAIDVSGKGYQATAGPGAATASYGGGDHGGAGGGALGGGTYGSDSVPNQLGSGGYGSAGVSLANYILDGSGGGFIYLSISGTLTNDGSISANGKGMGCCISYGAGAGGSVLISTANITGAGTIEANGGEVTGSGTKNGGGGGRVAIYYTTDTYTGLVSANGGPGTTNNGVDGTLYTGSYPSPTP